MQNRYQTSLNGHHARYVAHSTRKTEAGNMIATLLTALAIAHAWHDTDCIGVRADHAGIAICRADIASPASAGYWTGNDGKDTLDATEG